MLGGVRIQRGGHDDAEKPFWISFADLMTALMVLFLVVMVSTLLALTSTFDNLESTRAKFEKLAKEQAAQRASRSRQDARIDRFWDSLEASSRNLGVKINRDAQVINFGDRGRFATGRDDLTASDQRLVRRFVSRLVTAANTETGQNVVKRVVVEGYADRRGSYLSNLNLSSNRGQRVLCTLLQPGGAYPLSPAAKSSVRRLFLVGGFSSNSQKSSLSESRRAEIRLEFLGVNERRQKAPPPIKNLGSCALDG